MVSAAFFIWEYSTIPLSIKPLGRFAPHLVSLHESSQASGLFERHPTIDHAGKGSTSAG